MKKWRFDIFMPFLMAVYPILFFYSINFYKIDMGDVVVTLVISVAVAVVLLLLCRLIFRSIQRALFVSGLILLLFYTYGHAFAVAQTFRHVRFFPFDKDPALLAVWGALFTAGIIFAIRGEKHLPGLNRYVGMITAALAVVALLNISVNAVTANTPEVVTVDPDFDLHAPEVLPDIYYIILDEYAGQEELVNSLGFDNSQFLQSLEARGFYVASNSRSNYSSTAFSLASSLNMGYLDSLYGHRNDDLQPLYRMIQDNRILYAVQSLGYTYIQFITNFPVTRSNPNADILFNGFDEQRIKIGDLVEIDSKLFHINDYHLTLAETTLLRPFVSTVMLRDERIRNQANLEELVRIAQMPEATFTLAHFVLPHAPFIFTPDEGPENPDMPVDGQVVDRDKYEPFSDYINQLIFTNRIISKVVDDILAQSDHAPIIIIQGDHGFRWLCEDCYAESKNWDDEHYYNTIQPILNVYYLPDGGSAALYPTISPVNSFRVVFDTYFGADLELLEDRHYRPVDYYSRAYDFIDITYLGE
ncbi:MAG: hypothetical protein H6671_15000 [Anaerolineaceae bacterium]|nr:hypothetical protein [Anaerolineaceae bacterium]